MKNKIIAILFSLAMVGGVVYIGYQTPEPQEEVEEIEPIVEEIRYLSEQDLAKLYSYHIEKRIPDEIEFTQSEAQLLMKVARAEAGSELIPQMWVMRTILNRVKSDNHDFKDINSVGEACFQAGQFQVVKKKTFETVELNENSHLALSAVEQGWNGTSGALYFKASSDKTEWFDQNLTFIQEVGGQMYYK